jgi:hypothetical protein
MGRLSRRKTRLLLSCAIGFAALQAPAFLQAQQIMATSVANVAPAGTDSAADPRSQQQMADILRILGEVKQELRDSRREVEDLKREVGDLREEVAASAHGPAGAEPLKAAVDQLREDQDILQSQIKTLDQSKVGTASRYPLRLNGMVLFNSFVVDGSVDNPVLPLVALPRNALYPHHSFGASLEQTQLGLDASGPRLGNAHTSADVTVDFFNPVIYTVNSEPSQIYPRLRTANAYLDWENTRISGGLQTPLISPLSPTSFATVGEPALAWSGNLWTWLPQVTIEHRTAVGVSSHAVVAAGLIDPTAGYATGAQAYEILRHSSQPGYESRLAYEWGDGQRPYEIGVNGYYARQSYIGSQTAEDQGLDFWAGTADWRVPIARIAELSGEFYRGRGIGDLGGGAFKNTVFQRGAVYSQGLDATGGWAQWKSRLTRSLEVNAYFGEDSAEAREVRNPAPVTSPSPYLYLVRNQSTAANLIFRPRSYLIFSGEYRYLRSWYIYGPTNSAQTLDLTMGYLF